MVFASGGVSESLQWLCLVTLFLASVVTLIIYLVQYFGVFRSRTWARGEECEEADRLLSWVLELKSWRTEWRRAWIRALNSSAQVCVSAHGVIHVKKLSSGFTRVFKPCCVLG